MVLRKDVYFLIIWFFFLEGRQDIFRNNSSLSVTSKLIFIQELIFGVDCLGYLLLSFNC